MEEDYMECTRCKGRGYCRRSEEGGWWFNEKTMERVYPEKGEPNDEYECPTCGGRGEVYMNPITQDDGSHIHVRHQEYWDTDRAREHQKKQREKRERKKVY